MQDTKKPSYRHVLLPQKAINIINALPVNLPTKNKMKLCLFEMSELSQRYNKCLSAVVYKEAHKIRSEYFANNPRTPYFMSLLEKAKLLIKVKPSIWAGKGSKANRMGGYVSPLELYEDLTEKRIKGVKAKARSKECKHTESILSNCRIDVEKAETAINDLVNDLERLIYQNHKIKIGASKDFFKTIHIWDSKNGYLNRYEKMTQRQLLTSFFNPNYTIIRNGKAWYYMPVDKFIKKKQISVSTAYRQCVLDWQQGIIFTKVDKYGRLHSNATNTPNILLKNCITYKGRHFIELDLANSQMRFFCYALLNQNADNQISRFAQCYYRLFSSSTKKFIEACCEGQIYEHLASKLNIDRSQAKQGVFETLFSSGIKETDFLKMMRVSYPEITLFIEEYKSVYGFKEFSRELQRIESSIMIGTIYSELCNEGLKVITKHDSFLIDPEDYKNAFFIIKDLLERIFKRKYKIR